MINFSNKITKILKNKALFIVSFIMLTFIALGWYFLPSRSSLAASPGKENVLPSPTPSTEPLINEYYPESSNTSVENLSNGTTNFGSTMLMLEENGFVNSEINLSSGRNLLLIQNKTVWTLKLYIKNSSGVIEKEIYVEPSPQLYKGIIDLPVGHYDLMTLEQTQFNCRININ